MSIPHATHAPTISSDERFTVVPGSHTSRAPAAVTRAAAVIMLRPRCSRNNVAASTTVATSSRFNSNDAVAAGVSTSPAISRAGPIAPPATIATATSCQSRRSATTSGRSATHQGATASAAPR